RQRRIHPRRIVALPCNQRIDRAPLQIAKARLSHRGRREMPGGPCDVGVPGGPRADGKGGMSTLAMVSKPATWLARYVPDLPTPFDLKGEIDLNAFRGLCERQIQAGATALVVCETAGEASTLSPAEQETIIRSAVDVARRRTRIIAGAG